MNYRSRHRLDFVNDRYNSREPIDPRLVIAFVCFAGALLVGVAVLYA